jgi:large subunit ribosomal protein L40e
MIIEVYIVPYDKYISLEVKSTDTIMSVKKKINNIENIDIDKQLLTLEVKQLMDDKTLEYYLINTKSRLYVYYK